MEHVYEGKTKSVFKLPDGNYLLKFKDDATGQDGVFDPGSNEVGLTIEGLGKESLKMSRYYFVKLQKSGFETHYIDSDLDQATMTVKPAKTFGKGLEVICRFKATGSFMRRYGAYADEGQDLNGFVEITLKDDGRGDPPITKDALVLLDIMTEAEYEEIKKQCKEIASFIQQDLKSIGCELYDVKFEFGKYNGAIVLIDEISGGNMRVYKDGTYLMPMDLVALVLNR